MNQNFYESCNLKKPLRDELTRGMEGPHSRLVFRIMWRFAYPLQMQELKREVVAGASCERCCRRHASRRRAPTACDSASDMHRRRHRMQNNQEPFRKTQAIIL